MNPKIKAYLALARISNSPTILSNVLAGAAITGDPRQPALLAQVFAAVLLFYIAGMFMNDWFDLEEDRIHRPQRPIASGQVSRNEALAWIILMLAAGSLILFNLGIEPFISGVALIALITFYNWRHGRDWLSPFVMAACRGMVYVITFLAFSGRNPAVLARTSAILFLYVAGVSLIARVEIQNRSAARAVGPLIAGIALVDAMIVFRHEPGPLALIPIACFFLTLILQRFIRGT